MARRCGLRVSNGMLVLAVTACVTAQPVHAQSESTEKIYQRLLKSTVWVVVPKKENASAGKIPVTTGSGSLVDRAHKLVLTNYHVVRESENVIVAFPSYQNGKSTAVAERSFYQKLITSGGGIRGKVVAREKKCDLALIQLDSVPEDAKQLPLARESASPGQDVHSVGNPGQSGALWVYTPGKVRQVYHHKWRASAGKEPLDLEARVVETQSPINRGDSGGPLVNNKGELVAVTQGHLLDAQQLSLFIDVSEVKSFMKSKKFLPAPSKDNSRTVASNPTPKPQDDETKAAGKLRFAKALAMDGKLEKAKTYCEEIIESYPKTKAAGQAQEFLDKLRK